MKKRLLFIIDPWETLDHPRDTTLRLIEESILLGANCSISENRTLGLERGQPFAEISKILKISSPRTPNRIQLSAKVWAPLSNFDHIFYRTDPPVDLSYLLPLQILSATTRRKTGKHPQIHSSPESLFFLNEKWAPAELGPLFPPSLVSASSQRLEKFLLKIGKGVLKPLYLAQSRGVEVLDSTRQTPGERKARIESATEGGRLPVILQAYLPGIFRGETRLWFSGGKLIASAKKIPKSGESIIDMDQGGTLTRVKLSAREKSAVKKIGPFLKKHKILFAAVDLIDAKITDFNHTSPGLLVAMEELLGENLARKALEPITRADRDTI